MLATDPKTGRTAAKRVNATHRNKDTYLTKITVRSGAAIHTTQNHRFWDERTKAWVEAGNLRTDDSQLRDATTKPVALAGVLNYTGARQMHDLTVADVHTYYVVAGTTPVLVHNCNGATLELTYKPDWTPVQRAAADDKVAALNASGNLVVTKVKRGKSASSTWSKAGNSKPGGSDIDHTVDLQLGGADDILNMNPLDLSVNRSLGSQIASRIKTQGLQPGARVCSITIRERC